MQKIIHYCWFGGNPLSKEIKKCISSWKKYFPDYEIKEWNEKNFNVEITNYSKVAYENKKWAFVSDVARIYALKEYGGIYLDTDMIVKKKCEELFDCGVVLGWESNDIVNCAVVGVNDKNSELINKIWNFYLTHEFNVDDLMSISIPNIVTNILKSEYSIVFNSMETQVIDNKIKIYARDYFYPISSCKDLPNVFTKRTCMIHYYIGSWTNNDRVKQIRFQMLFGVTWGDRILKFLVMGKRICRKTISILLHPFNRNSKDTTETNDKN